MEGGCNDHVFASSPCFYNKTKRSKYHGHHFFFSPLLPLRRYLHISTRITPTPPKHNRKEKCQFSGFRNVGRIKLLRVVKREKQKLVVHFALNTLGLILRARQRKLEGKTSTGRKLEVF